LSPVAGLGAAVNAIGASGDLAARVPARGDDELAGLAHAVNRMLQALEHSESEAKDATTRYRLLFEEVQTGVLVIDASTHLIVDANSAAIQMLGAPKEQIVGKPCRTFCPEQTGTCAQDHEGQITTPLEGELLTAQGTHIAVVRATSGVVLKGQTHLLESIMDITSRKQLEKSLTHLAYFDPLTDVANRRTLEDSLERVLVEAREGVPSALLVLDADKFKPANDRFGHDAGDQVLIALTRVIQQNLRSTDLLARLGGDEFAVLMAGTAIEAAREVAERVRSKIEEATIDTSASSFRLTVSIGVVAIDGSLSVRESMAQADQAMYHAKQRGRNRIEVE
jgi:diguanylate cyclase (GGDEF)-like protein/PAS domain S-box-containing protein